MQITGSYLNYQNMTSLLSSLGVQDSGNLIMQVFESSIKNLQDKIDSALFSEASAKAVTELYGEISNLAGRASKLTLDDINSAFNDRTPVSSDSNVLTATAIDSFSADSGASEATYTITVNQLARSQENTGLELNATDLTSVDQGTNTFNININGQDFELSITVEEGDTNEDVLQKIVTAVNGESGLEVTAQVMEGSLEGARGLVIQSDNTGTANEFAITDLTGNAVSVTGADTVSQSALDASYTVDGEAYVSNSNTVYLDEGLVTVDLKGVGKTTLTVAPDKGKVGEAVTSFASGINSFLEFLGDNKDYISDEVGATINSYLLQHKSGLESLGITVNDEGMLEVDNAQLNVALEKDFSGLKEALGGFDGLAVQVKGRLDKMALDSPLNYTKEAKNMSPDFTDYIYGVSASMLSQIYQGMLLNTYV